MLQSKPVRKTCLQCKTRFYVKHKNTDYCSVSCRNEAKNSRKREDKLRERYLRLELNEFWLWVFRECKRSGTVEILTGQTVETLSILEQLYNSRFKCYGYDKEKKKSKYHLCHIQPAKGIDSTGLLHHLNLFIGDANRNQKHGNKVPSKDVGLSIPRSSLKPKWKVEDDETMSQIRSKVVEFLGSVLDDYIINRMPKKGSRFTLAKWLVEHGYKWPDGRLATYDELKIKSGYELAEIRADFENKPVFKLSVPARRTLCVYKDEVERLSGQLSLSRHQQDLEFLSHGLLIVGSFLSQRFHAPHIYDEWHEFKTFLVRPRSLEFQPLRFNAAAFLDPSPSEQEERISKLRDYMAHVCYETLQGFPLDREKLKAIISRVIAVNSFKLIGVQPFFTYPNEQDRRDELVLQIPCLMESLQLFGMMTAEEVAVQSKHLQDWEPNLEQIKQALIREHGQRWWDKEVLDAWLADIDF